MKGMNLILFGLALLYTLLFTLSLCASANAQEQGGELEGPDKRGRAPNEVARPNDTPAGYRRRHALVIGIDEYKDATYPDLGYAVADARAVAKTLVERFGFAEEDVRLLLNNDATQDALADALEVWASDPDRVDTNDLLVVFFAGHGVTRDLGSRGSRGYLVPVDGRSDRRNQPHWGSLLDMADLEGVSEVIPAKHVLFVLDCCFGGLAVNRAAPPVAAGLTSRARQVITAGNASQTVLDSGGRRGHSVFTGALLDALEGRADLDGDQVITFGELFNYVGRDVERRTEKRQTPLQSTFPDHEGGSVALFPPGIKPGRMSATERLKALERTADERLAEVERLSDVILVDQMLEEVTRLYPAHPDKLPALREWLSRARELAERRDQHEESVRLVRQEAYLSQVVAGLLEDGEGTEPVWDKVDRKLFWRFRTFGSLIERLDSLDARIPEVEGRLAWASQIEELTRNHPNAIYSWDEAREAVAAADGVLASELYREHPIDLRPQLGLVPMGMNPATQLWEFYHLRSAWNPGSGVDPAEIAIPEHAEDGSLDMRDESAMVFVLIPGGTFWMGAQATDRSGRNFDPQAESDESHGGSPVKVTLDAYFLSKYELTQGQWLRIMGSNPSTYGPGERFGDHTTTLLHPVEQVSWAECVAMLGRLNLQLPTEAQWEYGCRAGTETPWWTGSEKGQLQEVLNLADEYCRANGGPAAWKYEEDLNDGYTLHAPVGRFRANPFGLHDVIGNVWEWCLDDFVGYGSVARAGDGRREVPGASNRVLRGGGFSDLAVLARSAERSINKPTIRVSNLGVRPSRIIR